MNMNKLFTLTAQEVQYAKHILQRNGYRAIVDARGNVRTNAPAATCLQISKWIDRKYR